MAAAAAATVPINEILKRWLRRVEADMPARTKLLR
jgi:hypothetical protein